MTPTSAFKLSSPGFSFLLSAIACPLQTGGRKESLFRSAAAYTETQCLSSL